MRVYALYVGRYKANKILDEYFQRNPDKAKYEPCLKSLLCSNRQGHYLIKQTPYLKEALEATADILGVLNSLP